MDFNLYKEHYSSTYHVALCSVFKGLDNFQPLFESHLFDQICSDTSKFLKWKLKKKKREKKDSWCTMYSFPLMFRNSILWRITAKMLTILTLLLVIVTKLPQWAHCAALAAPSYLMSVAVIICLFFFPLIVIYYGIIGCFNN